MDLHSESVRLATRLIVEESSESETTDTLGREFTRAAQSRSGYRAARLALIRCPSSPTAGPAYPRDRRMLSALAASALRP